jgi:SAM-dependent methyltransferase
MIDKSLNYGRHLVKKFLKQSIPYTKVLDVGAGNGSDLFLAQMVNRNSDLHALEYYPPNISLLKSCGISVSSIDIEKETFPFDDGSFDIIIANQILEHTIELFWIFHEITRVLKKGGGKLIIGVPNLASLHNRFLLSIGRQPTSIKSASAHIRGFTKPDMVCFVNTCWPGGYKLVKWGGSNFYPFHQLSPNLWRRCFLPWHGDYLCSLKKTANTMMNLLSFQSMKILKPTFL